MKRKDLRNNIIETKIEHAWQGFRLKNLKDLIFLDDVEEIRYIEKERKIAPTDYAIMNNVSINYRKKNDMGEYAVERWLRTENTYRTVKIVSREGGITNSSPFAKTIGVCPSMHYKIPIDKDERKELKIEEVKNPRNDREYHLIRIGEYPITKLDENLSDTLEKLYNKGNLKEGIYATGRWFSVDGQKETFRNYAGKHNPEFEYQGNRYVRVTENQEKTGSEYSDGTLSGKIGTVRWTKVEPISFIIRNWNDMPKEINKNGNGKAKYFDLRAEKAIVSNIPFYPNIEEESALWENSTIRGFLNGIEVENKSRDFYRGNIDGSRSNFTGICNFLNEAFNLNRKPILEYMIPETETEIPDDAFNGCVTLKDVIIPPSVKKIGKRAFEGLSFKYSYRTDCDELVFSHETPSDKTEVIDISELKSALNGFDGYNSILTKDKKLKTIIELAKELKKSRFSIPYAYAIELIENKKANAFFKNSIFKFFKNEVPNIDDILENYSDEEKVAFFKFITAIGCFSKEKIVDKNGRETEVLLAQKASSLFARLLKENVIDIHRNADVLNSINIGTVSNQEFLKFIAVKDKDEGYQNLKLILKLEEECPGILYKTMTNFRDAKSYRESIGNEGTPVKISWENALRRFYTKGSYKNITDENLDIATLFAGKGIKQKTFNKASKMRNKAIENNIPEHILGKEIKEETILESIEKIKNQTKKEIKDIEKILGDVYEKEFTYEWLSKNDPRNFIIGIYCSCCAIIDNTFYGGNIVKATVTEPDVQNLVVRNRSGKIVGKGSIYLNEEESYVVINDFEINERYKRHEDRIWNGKYNVPENSSEEKEREQIFKTFQRGIIAFIEEYDRQHPDKKLQQVNVGTNYNKLKSQIKKFERAETLLYVPGKYCFRDTEEEQYVLYKRKEKENGGFER